MELEQTEQEQVEALQKWWRENWLALVGGLVLGVGAILGWQYYGSAQQEQAAEASMAYEAIRGHLQAGNVDTALASASALATEHKNSPYVVQAYMAIAAKQAETSDWGAAETALRTAHAVKQEDAMRGLVELRLARVLWAQNKAEEALGVLEQPVAGYEPLYFELRGDIASAQSQPDTAREAYAKALADDADYLNREAIQRKLDALN